MSTEDGMHLISKWLDERERSLAWVASNTGRGQARWRFHEGRLSLIRDLRTFLRDIMAVPGTRERDDTPS